MNFKVGRALNSKEYKAFREIADNKTLNEEESRKAFDLYLRGDVVVTPKKEEEVLTRGQKAAKTKKQNKAKAEAKAEVDAEIAKARAKAEAEEEV